MKVIHEQEEKTANPWQPSHFHPYCDAEDCAERRGSHGRGDAPDGAVGFPAPLRATKGRDTLEMTVRRVEKARAVEFLTILPLWS